MLKRMKMLGTVVTGCAVALLASFNAQAQEDEADYAQNGFYLALALAGAKDDHYHPLSSADYGLGLGIDFRVGYRIHPRVAIEGEVEYIDGFFTAKSSSAEYNVFTATGNVKVFLLTGRIQPYVLSGVGITQSQTQDSALPGPAGDDFDETGLSARFGGGIDVYITEHISVGAGGSYVVMYGCNGGDSGCHDGLDYISVSLGAQFRF